MEGSVLDVFRVLSLVAVWAIPATLIVALAAFILVIPAFTVAGALLRLYEVVRVKLPRRARAEPQPQRAVPAVPERGSVGVGHTAKKELVEMKS